MAISATEEAPCQRASRLGAIRGGEVRARTLPLPGSGHRLLGHRRRSEEESTTSAPSTTPTAKTQQGQTREPAGERADLISFQLDDRSQAGFSNIWLVWTIKNNSSEKSNYSWDWEAVDADGTRVEDGSQLETNVQPGQTARGELLN